MSGGLITAFADAGGGQVTVTSNGHGMVNLATVTIEDTTSYNGFFEISNVATNTYQITDTFVSNDATGRYTTDSSPFDFSTSLSPTVTSGTAGNVGAYAHAFTTSEEINWLNITFDPMALTDEQMLIEIATGLDASEVVQITFPMFVNFNPGGNIQLPPLPIKIAAGIEVKIRVSSTGASEVLGYSVSGTPTSAYGTSSANESIGIGTRVGTDVDPGSTNNSMGLYTQISASSSITSNYMLICLGNSNNNGQTAQDFIVEIASGASSSEINVRSPTPFNSLATELSSIFVASWVDIDASSRITARCQSSNTADANDRIIDVAIILFTVTAPAGGSGGTPKLINGGLAR